MQETETLLEGAQLSANRFYCCGITDNPGRSDSKSTQVTRGGGLTRETEQKNQEANTHKLVGIRAAKWKETAQARNYVRRQIKRKR